MTKKEGRRNLRGLVIRRLGLLDKCFEYIEADLVSAVIESVQHIIKLFPLILAAHPERF